MPYIRFYATTNEGSTTAVAALAYLRSIVRIAPVRLVTFSGSLDGAWGSMTELLLTPMIEPMVANIVCTEPENWAHRLTVPMPKRDPFASFMKQEPGAAPPAEKATRVVELYTANTRNVLIATSIPKSKAHCEAAAKYESIVVPTPELAEKITGAIGRPPLLIPVPVTEHRALRGAIVT